jgi:hypothetical protein
MNKADQHTHSSTAVPPPRSSASGRQPASREAELSHCADATPCHPRTRCGCSRASAPRCRLCVRGDEHIDEDRSHAWVRENRRLQPQLRLRLRCASPSFLVPCPLPIYARCQTPVRKPLCRLPLARVRKEDIPVGQRASRFRRWLTRRQDHAVALHFKYGRQLGPRTRG